jgi:hypothetical protein
MGDMSISSTILCTKHYENAFRKEEANVRMNTKEMSCKDVHCIHVGKNGRRGILPVTQGPPFLFPI